jgi:hypothetical protein
MAVGVVDLLEVIDVEHREGERPLMARGALRLLPEPPDGRTPVEARWSMTIGITEARNPAVVHRRLKRKLVWLSAPSMARIGE